MARNKLSAKILDRVWLIVSLAVSAIVQLSFISKSSIWHDEGYSLLLAPQTISQIIERTARDVHPPLYYLSLHFWTNLFGTSELAARSLSTLAILLTIIVMFKLTKQLFGSGAARLSVALMAIGPFLIRYGQEARMYALVTLLLTLGTYLLVSAFNRNQPRRLYLYGLVMALALYTHYYTIFMIPVHWVYVFIRSRGLKDKNILSIKSKHWWGANGLALLLFLPWAGAAYGQFTRVQGGFWIPPVTIQTIPATLAQWLHFTSFDGLGGPTQLGIFALIVGLVLIAIWRDRLGRIPLILLASWTFAGPLGVWAISLVTRPIYVDRYFVFAAVAFYPLLATILYSRPLYKLSKLRPILVSVLIAVMISGIQSVYRQSNHQMRDIGQVVSDRYQSGDQIIAGELYVYLDFSYYNKTAEPLKLYAPNGISGYGETSLLYDKPLLIIKDYRELNPSSGVVWVIGKAGDKDYFDKIPAHWQLTDSYQAKESAARRYLINSPTLLSFAN